MDAIVVDLKNFGLQTPEQLVRMFFRSYDGDKVKAELWEVFRLLAVSKNGEVIALEGNEEWTCLLFDNLLNLVWAVELLMAGGSEAGCCVICGAVHPLKVPDR